MSRPRRLVVVSDYAWRTGGVEEFVCAFVARAAQTHQCRVVSWSAEIKLPTEFSGLRVIEHGDVRPMWAELDDADVVVVVTSFNVRLLARAAVDYLVRRRLPAVVVVQTSDHSVPATSSSTQEAWLVALAEASHHVVAVSSDVQDALARISGFPTERTTVIENGARLCTRRRRARGHTRVSFIGRPHPQKGYDLFERLAQDFAPTPLTFAANTVSVRPAAHVAGVEYSYQLTDSELVRFFDAADVIVAPYVKADGLPLAILEALACGAPVIGFDVPGLGPLLRRHGQAAIRAEYEALRTAVDAWRTGHLDLRAPAPGTVCSLDGRLAQYMDLIDQSASVR